MTLRTDPELDAALTALAELEGVSKQQAARRAILEAAERRSHQRVVSEASASSRARWGDVLDRLGSV